jgi:hypothetical protein
LPSLLRPPIHERPMLSEIPPIKGGGRPPDPGRANPRRPGGGLETGPGSGFGSGPGSDPRSGPRDAGDRRRRPSSHGASPPCRNLPILSMSVRLPPIFPPTPSRGSPTEAAHSLFSLPPPVAGQPPAGSLRRRRISFAGRSPCRGPPKAFVGNSCKIPYSQSGRARVCQPSIAARSSARGASRDRIWSHLRGAIP